MEKCMKKKERMYIGCLKTCRIVCAMRLSCGSLTCVSLCSTKSPWPTLSFNSLVLFVSSDNEIFFVVDGHTRDSAVHSTVE